MKSAFRSIKKKQLSDVPDIAKSGQTSLNLDKERPPKLVPNPDTDYLVEYDYEAQEIDELTIKKGDVLTKVVKIAYGWWEGALGEKRGMFPDNYVRISSQKEEMAALIKSLLKSKLLKVLYSYTPEDRDWMEGDLQLEVGDLVEFIGEESVGWLRGKLKERVGLFPFNFVKGYEPPAIGTVEGNEKVEEEKHPLRVVGEQARVTFPYAACREDELTLNVGDIVNIIAKNTADDGWWWGALREEVGVFPDNFVVIIPPTHPINPASDSNTSQLQTEVSVNQRNIPSPEQIQSPDRDFRHKSNKSTNTELCDGSMKISDLQMIEKTKVSIENMRFLNEEGELVKEFDITDHLDPSCLEELFVTSTRYTKVLIVMHKLPPTITALSMVNCNIQINTKNVIPDENAFETPFQNTTRVKIDTVQFCKENGETINPFDITKMLQGAEIHELTLCGSNIKVNFEAVKKIPSVHMQGIQLYCKPEEIPPNVRMEKLSLHSVSFCNEKAMDLPNVNFFDMLQFNVSKLSVVAGQKKYILFDFAKLPIDIEELTLKSVTVESPKLNCAENPFENLKMMRLENLKNQSLTKSGQLFHKFTSLCTSLQYLTFIQDEDVHLDLMKLPKSLKFLELKGHVKKTVEFTGNSKEIPFTLDSLILDKVPFGDCKDEKMRKLLNTTRSVVIKNMDDVRQMSKKEEIKTLLLALFQLVDLEWIAIGKLYWNDGICDFLEEYGIEDEQDFYRFEKIEGIWKGKGMDLEKFGKLYSMDYIYGQSQDKKAICSQHGPISTIISKTPDAMENLTSKMFTLCEKLTNIIPLMTYLEEKDVITFSDRETIGKLNTTHEKARMIFHLVTKKGYKWSDLKVILIQTGNTHVVDEVEEST